MTDKPHLIECAFPLKQTSLASVYEKNVRHGHISTLHIWPARRPLAACRPALLATLLPDPGTPEEQRKLCERISGTVVEKIEHKKIPNGRIVKRKYPSKSFRAFSDFSLKYKLLNSIAYHNSGQRRNGSKYAKENTL